MSNRLRKFIVGLLTVFTLVFVIAGLVTEVYLISVGGLALIFLMLLERTWHIHKLNKQIEEMKGSKNPLKNKN
ncbi:MAG: hypothetical protein U5N56_09960 [Candidatus Marinimicrobia bacterium]|nr:hypothetical protein [Candidatus Neomarinimicrobiota bacterium]